MNNVTVLLFEIFSKNGAKVSSWMLIWKIKHDKCPPELPKVQDNMIKCPLGVFSVQKTWRIDLFKHWPPLKSDLGF